MKTLFPFLLSIILLAACNTGAAKQETAVANTNAVTPVATALQPCGDTISEAKIEEALSMEVLADMTKEEVKDWKQAKQKPRDLLDFRLDTTYNNVCILSVTAWMEGLAAHPYYWEKYINLNATTGEHLLSTNEIESSQLTNLLADCNEKIKRNVVEKRKEIEREEPEYLNVFDEYIAEVKSFELGNLRDWYITDTAIIFVFEFPFRYIDSPLKPSRDLIFSKSEFRRFVRGKSVLQAWLGK